MYAVEEPHVWGLGVAEHGRVLGSQKEGYCPGIGEAGGDASDEGRLQRAGVGGDVRAHAVDGGPQPGDRCGGERRSTLGLCGFCCGAQRAARVDADRPSRLPVELVTTTDIVDAEVAE